MIAKLLGVDHKAVASLRAEAERLGEIPQHPTRTGRGGAGRDEHGIFRGPAPVLQNDGVWVVHASGPLAPRQGSTDAKKRDLLAKDAAGGFSPEVRAVLRSDPALASEIAARLLENHFPESIHPDILAAVGLTLGVDEAAAKKRDPRFRQRVLTAYEYRCAVCGFSCHSPRTTWARRRSTPRVFWKFGMVDVFRLRVVSSSGWKG
jgi:hypothetical protein